MGWHGHLSLKYRRDGERCIVHDRHHGPLRVLQTLYPDGAAGLTLARDDPERADWAGRFPCPVNPRVARDHPRVLPHLR